MSQGLREIPPSVLINMFERTIYEKQFTVFPAQYEPELDLDALRASMADILKHAPSKIVRTINFVDRPDLYNELVSLMGKTSISVRPMRTIYGIDVLMWNSNIDDMSHFPYIAKYLPGVYIGYWLRGDPVNRTRYFYSRSVVELQYFNDMEV